MAYIDNSEQFEYEVYDKTAMEDFGSILERNGWVRVKHFYKLVVGRKQYNLDKKEIEANLGVSQRPYRPYLYASAKHVIYQNASGRYLGMAEILVDSFKLLPLEFINAAPNGASTEATSPAFQSALEQFPEKFKSTFDTNKVKGLTYYYTLENLPSVEDGFMTITYPIESLNEEQYYSTALDIELNGYKIFPVGDVSYSTEAKKRDLVRNANDDEIRGFAEPHVMQSTVVPVELFNSVVESDSVENVYSALNKWDDSIVTVRGRIDGDSITVIFQSDNSAKWDGNRNPQVPLHFGEVEMESGRKGVYALFGGVTPTTAQFDYSSITKYTGNANTRLVMPVLKSYPSYPGDGVNNVVLSRTRGGARYQAVYLSWGASPEAMPPNREATGGRHYPRAMDFDVRNFGFNPSRYSDSIHTSNIYLVHPEDGVIGKLKNLVGLQTFATNNPELRIRREHCPDKITDAFHVFTVGSLCPITKLPSTTYSLASIGIRGKVVEKPKYTKVPVPVNVKASKRDGKVHVSWDIDSKDYHHSHVDIDIDGIIVFDNASGIKSAVIDLSNYSGLDINTIGTIGITSINDRGSSSDVVEVPIG